MFPEFTVFSRQIPSYSVAVFVGAVLAVIYEKLREKKYPDLIRDSELIFIYAGLGAAVGAKLLYLLLEIPNIIAAFRIAEDPLAVVKAYFLGGFVFFGGFYGCIAAVWIYCRVTKLSLDRTLQLFLPMFPLIHGFGRIGCFLVGCCHGKEAPGSPLAVVFTNSPVAPNGIPLYPVQLVEAVIELFLFAVLAVLAAKNFSGLRLLVLYSGAYSAVRFLLEFFRGDEARGIWFGLSTSQYIALVTMVLAALLAVRYRRMQQKE